MSWNTNHFEEAVRAGLAAATDDVVVPADMGDRVARTRRSLRRRRMAMAGLLPAAAVVSAVAAVTAIGGAPAPSTSVPGRQAAPAVVEPSRAAGINAKLVGMTFTLPEGFTTGAGNCSRPSLAGTTAELVSEQFSRRASASGGCLYIAMVAPPPPGGRSVEVGSNDAHLQTDGDQLTLSVVHPNARNSRGIVFVSSGLTESELLSIARSGFSSLTHPGPECTADCG